jgi:parallel beta-helix repeat protein
MQIQNISDALNLGWGELSDMGGVYTLGKSEGTTVSNNVIHHIYSHDYGGWGLYTDEGSTGVVMENNLVYRCKNAGFHQHYGEGNRIQNNIFADNLVGQLQATRVEKHESFAFIHNLIYFSQGTLYTSNWHRVQAQFDYNGYWDTRRKDLQVGKLSFAQWQEQGKDVHSVIADPDFVNPAGYDFHIKNKALLAQIGFKLFDYTKAGVYGKASWLKLAQFDPDLARQFDQIMK